MSCPGAGTEPVTLVDVIRAAVARSRSTSASRSARSRASRYPGPAVNDVVHLIAELAENAASLSAADTPVDISGRTLASGGVLVEVTDQGVGMNPEMMAQANWRLDNPPAIGHRGLRNMGLFVVGRLAARHGIKVRLQPATAGGLTALVWLPDAIVALPVTAPGRPAGTDVDGGRAERDASAGSLRPAPAPAPTPVPVPDASHRPGPAGPGSGQRPNLRLRPPRPRHAPASGPEANPAVSPAEERRLPIYDAVESDWFANRHKPFGSTAAAEDSWASPVDKGWHAAQSVIAPSSSGLTTAACRCECRGRTWCPARSAARNRPPRGRLGPLTRPVTGSAGSSGGPAEGRAAASAAASPGEGDKTS